MRRWSTIRSPPKGFSPLPGLALPQSVFSLVLVLKHAMHRDIYYKDPSLFCKQEVVDRYIDDLAYTFEVPRSALNVVGFLGLAISNQSISPY